MIRRAFLKAFGTAILGLALTKTLPGIGGADTPAIPEPPSHEFRVGDMLTFEGRYAMNPLTRARTDHLQQFIVTAIADGVGGEASLTLHPSIYGQPDFTWTASS